MTPIAPPSTPRSSALRRAVGSLLRVGQRPFRPVLRKLRDRQAPAVHHYMMHEASVPMDLPRGSALVIAPHADDETFGCGGLIALKRDAGVPVHVVIVTDGRNSHSHVAGVDVGQLIRTRKQEVIAACAILGVLPTDISFLDLPDQGLQRLADDQRNQAVARLADLLRAVRPDEVYVNMEWDGHPDHEATYRLTIDALREAGQAASVFEYPIWLVWKGPFRWNTRPTDLRGGGRLDVRAVQQRKQRAIEVYTSQLPVLPPGFLHQFQQGFELFFHRSRQL
jgi:LmbE family N-acetylglucosaminyl deacetylase